MEKQAVHNIYDKDGQQRRILVLQSKNPNAINEACAINQVLQGKLVDLRRQKNFVNNPRMEGGGKFDAFIQPKIPLLPKTCLSRKLTKPVKIVGKENAFRRGLPISETCEPGVHARPLPSKECIGSVKPTPRILDKASRRPSMARKLDFDTAASGNLSTPTSASCFLATPTSTSSFLATPTSTSGFLTTPTSTSGFPALPSNDAVVTAKAVVDGPRIVPPVIIEPVPISGTVEEVQTHFEVVEVLVVHDKPTQVLPAQSDVVVMGGEMDEGGVILSAEQPLHEDSDTIRHFMRYEIVDGRRVKIYECGICRRGFKHQYTLMRHLPTHTDERNFPCQVCGKAFRQMSTLIQHGAIHSNARPYTCDICQNTFNRVSTLISHKKTHSNDKPHLCTYCGKRFHQKGNLRNHIFTHTNERPYKCGMCDKGFNQKSNLICHRIRYHTVKQEYACEVCQCKFPKKHALKNHQLYKHNIAYDATKSDVKPTFDEASDKDQALLYSENDPSDYVSSYRDAVVVDCGADARGCEPDLETTPLYLNCISPELDKLLTAGQIALILFKPMGAAERLMKVSVDESHDRPTLVPATLADLKTVHGGGGGETSFDVCTAATFYQKYNEAGRLELAEAGYPAVCRIKIEPIVQNLVVTKIQAWPSATSSNNYASPFEYNPSSYQNNFNFPRFPTNHGPLWHNPHADFSPMAMDEEFNAPYGTPSVDDEMITPELLDGIAGYMDDPAGYVDGYRGQLDALTGYHGVTGYDDPLDGVTGFDLDRGDDGEGFVEYKYSSLGGGAVQLSLETVEVASEPGGSFYPLV